jgi:ADP-heptose:LPS heptosyltransferase
MILFKKKQYNSNEVVKILVIRISAMGDVAMTVPVLRSFIERYPQVKISALSQKRYAPFFTSGKTHYIGIELRHYQGLRGLYSLFKVLQKERFDVVLDLHDVLRSNVLRFFFRFIGTKVFVIDKGRRDKRALTRRKNKVFSPLKTSVERYADVFRDAGFALDVNCVNAYTPDEEIPFRVKALLPPMDEKCVCIGIAPCAAHVGKIYPYAKMAEVVDYFSSKGCKLYFFGSDSEKKIMQEWESKYPHCLSVAGKLSLKDEIMLISQLDLMISMDSANMHIASLVGVPVVSIWGATHPYAGFTGWRQSPENCVQVAMPCRPCSVYGNKKCCRTENKYACMNEITSSMIIEKVMSIVGQCIK